MKLKYFVITLLLVSAAQNISARQLNKPTDRDFEGLNGAVKRIEEQEAVIKMDGNLPKEGSKRFTRSIIFDKEGRMSRRQSSINGFDSSDFYYSYNEDGSCLVRYTTNDLRFPGSQGASAREQRALHLFTYEQNENAIFETVYMGDKPLPEKLTQKYKYLFDSNNRIIEKVMMTVAGKAVVKDSYTYSNDRNPIERKLQALGMAQPQIIKYSYDTLDAQGNWTKRTEENTLADKNKTKRIIVTYRKIAYY